MTCQFDPTDHTYRLNGRLIPGVTGVMELAGYCDDFSFADPVKRDAARERGTLIHEATAIMDRGPLDWDDLEPVLRPYCAAWKDFGIREPVEFEASEELVWTENYGGCAGMLDRRGFWNGIPCVFDIKTGKSLSKWTRYQLAGYVALHLERAGCQDIPGEFRRWQRRIVWLKEDGTYACPSPFTEAADLERFLAALVVAHTKLLHASKRKVAA